MANAPGKHPEFAPIRFVSRFRIIHAMYVMSVFGAGTATFGPIGAIVAALVCVYWAIVFLSDSRLQVFRALLPATLTFGLFAVAWLLLFSSVSTPREVARRVACENNLKRIAVALHAYHDVYKSFPPAYVADESGRPIHSWRVLILPFLREQTLYDDYRFDEPWDGPNNRNLFSRAPSVYWCPSQHEHNSKALTHTNYVAVVGDNTAWPGERAIACQEIVDGTVNTLLACEVGSHRSLWTEPTDCSDTEAVAMLTALDPDMHSGHAFQSFFYEWSHGRHIALADGSVRFLAHGIDAHDAELLLVINDYELHDIDNIRGAASTPRRLRTANCIRLGVFLLLALCPLAWVWIHPQGTLHGMRENEEAKAAAAEGER